MRVCLYNRRKRLFLHNGEARERLQVKAKKILYWVALLGCIGCAVVCAVLLGQYFWRGYTEQNALDKLAMEVTQPESGEPPVSRLEGYKKLAEQNGDMAGWISIDGTHINYPVMHTPDEPERYLHLGFDKQYAYSGLPFIEANCKLDPPTTHIMIYGHNMKNKTMFADIMNYRDQEFYENHPTIRFDTLNAEQEYEVVASYYASAAEPSEGEFCFWKMIEPESEEAFDTYISQMIRKSAVVTNVVPKYGDKLISLVTCTNGPADERFVVTARLVTDAAE